MKPKVWHELGFNVLERIDEHTYELRSSKSIGEKSSFLRRMCVKFMKKISALNDVVNVKITGLQTVRIQLRSDRKTDTVLNEIRMRAGLVE